MTSPVRQAELKDLGAVLVERKVITATQKAEAERQAQQRRVPVIQILEEQNLVHDEDVAKARSVVFQVPYVELQGKVLSQELLNFVPRDLASNAQMVAYAKEGAKLSVALVDPANFRALEAIEFIARNNNLVLEYAVTSLSSLQSILKQYSSLSAEVQEALAATAGAEKPVTTNLDEISLADKGIEEVIKTAPVSKMVAVILRHAIEGKASDIHIEPTAEGSRVRYRVDGILHTSIKLPPYVHSAIVARIKVISNLKLDETRLPQDGRFHTEVDGKSIDLRVSTLPLMGNEKVVMRILDSTAQKLTLTDLGFVGREKDVLQKSLTSTQGMVLSTGPTGSGKSTTLYTLMGMINKEDINIVTLEDPVEYHMEGVNQSQVNAEVGLSFANGLRSILRQDPDVIMVGEIRDRETAELAVNAALTGHLVFSTLHTNDAFGAVPRLIDMKVEPFLIAASLSTVIAQRLVRRICESCREPIDVPEATHKEVLEVLQNASQSAFPEGVNLKEKFTFMHGKGCQRCGNSGYRGRLVIAEVLEITEQMQDIITGGSKLADIKAEAKRQGVLTMKEDGFVKAILGMTTIEEVLRATQE
ncbi:MAG: ATPase, T2SS/T4P/T4SS family [Patescibacteria group bacterium]|jgi:type IV pilus assembly protein PilB